MGIFGLIATLAVFAVPAQGADLFQGYLIFSATPTCFKENNGPTMVAFPNGASSDCTLVKVSGTEADGFIIEEASDAAKQITFADTVEGTLPTLGAAGTDLKFVFNGNEVATVEALTDSDNPFVIDQEDVTTTGPDCVTGTLAYTNTETSTTCDTLLFYFELAACTGTNCKACLPDPAKCSECEATGETLNTDETACVADCTGTNCKACLSDAAMCSECEAGDALNTDETACVACSGTTSCTACTLDDQDAIQCSACSGANKLDNNACVACADGEVPNNAGTECQACDEGMVPSAAGTECEACPNGQEINDAGTACVCPDGQELNDAGTECEDSDDDSDDDTTTASGSGVILPSTAFITIVTLLGKQIFG